MYLLLAFQLGCRLVGMDREAWLPVATVRNEDLRTLAQRVADAPRGTEC